MTEICLRPWRLTDARDVSVMTDDEHLRHWSTMAADIDTWIQGEVAQQGLRRDRNRQGQTTALAFDQADHKLNQPEQSRLGPESNGDLDRQAQVAAHGCQPAWQVPVPAQAARDGG